jgi:hypothetical protein
MGEPLLCICQIWKCTFIPLKGRNAKEKHAMRHAWLYALGTLHRGSRCTHTNGTQTIFCDGCCTHPGMSHRGSRFSQTAPVFTNRPRHVYFVWCIVRLPWRTSQLQPVFSREWDTTQFCMTDCTLTLARLTVAVSSYRRRRLPSTSCRTYT